MERPNYLSKYLFEWEMIDVIIGGKSPLDSKYFLGPLSDEEAVNNFLKRYGLDYSDSVNRAELFGNFQESLQFIQKLFTSTEEKGIISLIDKIVVYTVLEQKIAKAGDTKAKNLLDTVNKLKKNTFESNFIKVLGTTYPTEVYMGGLKN